MLYLCKQAVNYIVFGHVFCLCTQIYNLRLIFQVCQICFTPMVSFTWSMLLLTLRCVVQYKLHYSNFNYYCYVIVTFFMCRPSCRF